MGQTPRAYYLWALASEAYSCEREADLLRSISTSCTWEKKFEMPKSSSSYGLDHGDSARISQRLPRANR
jgi:hypothetical protein